MGMELGALGLFSLAVAVLIITPGADMVFILSMAISGGSRAGIVAILGVATGAFCHVLLAIVGLAAIVAASEWLYRTLVIVGAIYIGWIGICVFRSRGGIGAVDGGTRTSLQKVFRQGLMTNLLNPKAIIFTLSFIPQFIPESVANRSASMLFLGAILVTIMVFINLPLALFAGKIGARLQRDDNLRRSINRFAGATLIVLSCYVIASRI